MTTTTEAASNPLAVLKPLVVIDTHEHACTVVLGADSVSRQQRDAAIEYLNKVLGSGGSNSFKLEESTTGGLYKLSGYADKYTGGDEFRAAVATLVQPKFFHTGGLSLKIIRADSRHMVGVEGTLTVTGRGLPRALPALAENPAEVVGVVHDGSSIFFSLKNLVKVVDGKPEMVTDADLIGDALRVATAFGIYVDKPPTVVADSDKLARMYTRYNLPDLGGES
jgi:hypothetical protein